MKIPMYFDYLDTNTKNIKKFNGWDLDYCHHIAYDDDDAESFIPWPLRDTMKRVNSTYKGYYYYPIYVHVAASGPADYFMNDSVYIKIPSKVKTDLRNNRAKLLLINIYEGHGWKQFEHFLMKKIIVPHNLKLSHVVFISGNTEPYINGIPNVYYNEWENIIIHHEGSAPHLFRECVERIHNDKLLPHKFLCLQRRPHEHRMAIYAEMYKHRDAGILTMGNGDFSDNYFEGDALQGSLYNLNLFYPKVVEKFKNLLHTIPREYDVNLATENPTSDDNVEKYLDSYLHIVSETFHQNEEGRIFFSEKIIKPFVFLQPFVLFGEAHSLKRLQELGYQTCGEFIDESYDAIENDQDRLYAALKSVKKFIKKDKEEMHQIMKDMLPIFIHNYFTLSKSAKEHPNLMPDLQKAFPNIVR